MKTTFTAPDQKLNELLDDPNNFAVIGEEGTKNTAHPTDLDLYLEEKYKSSFTNDAYDEYVGKYALSYYPTTNSQVKLEDVEIKQSDTENIYNFTAHVQYQGEQDKSKNYEVKGQANFSQDGKIAVFKILEDNGLNRATTER